MMDIPPIAQLVPHAGLMCLLERVVQWDQTQVVAATRHHTRSDNPLCRDGRLHAVHLCEYGAQAIAVHGALLAARDGGRAPPGYLVSLRDVTLAHVDVRALAGELTVSARCLYADAGGCQYSFRVEHARDQVASGRAAIVVQPAAQPG